MIRNPRSVGHIVAVGVGRSIGFVDIGVRFGYVTVTDSVAIPVTITVAVAVTATVTVSVRLWHIVSLQSLHLPLQATIEVVIEAGFVMAVPWMHHSDIYHRRLLNMVTSLDVVSIGRYDDSMENLQSNRVKGKTVRC